MRSVLTLRDITFNLDGESLALTALGIYKGLADLLDKHGAVRVWASVREPNGDRSIIRMHLMPQDLALKTTGDLPEATPEVNEMIDALAAGFAEVFDKQGRVVLPDLQDIVDRASANLGQAETI